MRIGVILPTFREDVDAAFDVARQCEEHCLDGVFAYDHLWPMGSPTRPALAPFAVLAAVATRSASLSVGPLVARVGMVSNDHLIGQFRTLHSLAPRRVICAVGTGDAKSADELAAYGLEFASAARRRDLVEEVATTLNDEMPVWIGAGSPATNAVARRLGVTLNIWGASASHVRDLSLSGPVTWAGPAPEDLPGWLDEVSDARAQWAIFAPGVDLAALGNWRRSHGVTKFR